ncbi:DUF4136 domain-containing protein [Winogradskyella echinorum]|uniref:DUF4136 domain-containing protein n=1 Tax=Winogradskyella echinorum TaxID=538189 RepID=A0ABR6Y447_9FLAO|nr:DUF4136 domain-containing protein [Winogradskyella echinorum]MBC3847513.1 DUF4136 domain-containing protein [Winogradskyella echinorum]MBC5751861.1 DUF4136 domain-containing protein [Winogradskyella echinorum]
MKKLLKFTPILVFAILLSSCSSVRVAADYDREANFDQYKTFAFFKPGIDKAEISDIDKRRILRAIEAELMAKGMTKSENPDMLVSIFTKSNQRVNIYNNAWGAGAWGWGGFNRWGWGWGPGFGGSQVSTKTEGMLFIDLIDTDKKELIWQGSGTGYLVTRNVDKKEARIKEFVSKTMEQFPPAK